MSIILTRINILNFIKKISAFEKNSPDTIEHLIQQQYWSIDIFKGALRFKISKDLPDESKLELIEIWLETFGRCKNSYIRET
jgi:Fe2+ or Zn2+ uptake regulation protein